MIAPALQSVSDFGDQVDTLAELLAKEETFGTNISSFITSTYSVVDDAAVTLLGSSTGISHQITCTGYTDTIPCSYIASWPNSRVDYLHDPACSHGRSNSVSCLF